MGMGLAWVVLDIMEFYPKAHQSFDLTMIFKVYIYIYICVQSTPTKLKGKNLKNS